ncbi:hypothetical protein [Halobiforma nitratireducens]|uniref:Uncharacterized protein n=1 Tax=Halobiforma nitratireducens JCM 10879 TaxID=1227454 RepID=M0LDN3_9EURY|nr:hypothetical protein [Halobiforma nitratireducens]EMA31701.1 hypothetical protein C446_15318 [Halobiforma nitratireducens JCM 10879]
MSTTTDSRRIDIDLRSDLGADDLPPSAPETATLTIAYNDDGGRRIEISHGQDEWTLEFDADGRCVDRDPPARQLPGWISDAVELVRGEL